jgi:transcription factor SPN1
MREVEKKKKRRRKDVDESEFLDDVTVFMAKMREAIELDKQSYEDNKPALEKLKLLPQIEKFLGNTYFQRLFLQSEGLNLLLEWIRKFPDGTYPALNQISSMLDIIHNLTLTLPYLRSCQIGGHVMELSKTSKVSKQIQKKARELVEKWSRIVWDINTNYSDIDTENRTYESLYRKKRCINEDDSDDESRKENTSASAVKKENPNDIYSHAKIPKKALFDFTHKPVSNVSESKDEMVKHRYNLFDKRSKGGRKKNE